MWSALLVSLRIALSSFLVVTNAGFIFREVWKCLLLIFINLSTFVLLFVSSDCSFAKLQMIIIKQHSIHAND